MTTLTKKNLIERVIIDDAGCWLWQGAIKNTSGRSLAYGWITYCNKQMNAHRAAWLVNFGDIPDGMFVCHKCDVPRCVNPQHLFLGSPSENMRDMWKKKRHCSPTQGIVGSRSSKLKLHEVAQIRQLLAAGQKQKAIADKFGVTQSAISLINIGKNWGRYV